MNKVLQRILGRLTSTLGRTARVSEAGQIPVPIIGAELAASPASSVPPVTTVAIPIIGAPEGSLRLAPSQPIIGTRRGVGYAEMFADRFVTWIKTNGLPLEWQVDELVDVAALVFAPAAGLELPIVRNLQGALKRRPDVAVEQDRRIYDRHGRLMFKRSFYRIDAGHAGMAAGTAKAETPAVPLPRAA